jgi:GTP pyrophosphokinase
VAKTSKAKSKIRLALKETQQKDGLYAKELLERRFKNKKIEAEERYHGTPREEVRV